MNRATRKTEHAEEHATASLALLPAARSGAAQPSSAGTEPTRSRQRWTAAILSLAAVALLLLVSLSHWLDESRESIELQSLMDDDRRETSAIVRLNESGAYSHFHTVTLLMKPRTEATRDVFERMHAVLSRYGHILSPLPAASCHVTLSGIFDRRRSSSLEQHNAWITREHGRLEHVKYAFNALHDQPLTFRVIGIQDWLVGVALLLQPAQLDDLQRLTALAELANAALGPLYKHEKWWHSSLAYKIPRRDIRQSELDELRSELLTIASSADIVVDRPRICNTRQFGSCDVV